MLEKSIMDIKKSSIETDIANGQTIPDSHTDSIKSLLDNELILAAKKGNIKIVNCLLLQAYTYGHRCPELMPALLIAAQHGYTEIVKLFLNNALLIAVRKSDLASIRILLAGGADVNYQQCSTGMTALLEAVVINNSEIVELLINSDAVTQAEAGYDQGLAALDLAVSSGYLGIIKLLIGAGADTKNALIIAVKNGHIPVVEFLLDEGVDVNQPSCYYSSLSEGAGYTALMIAAELGHTFIAKLLIDNGANINFVGQYQYTALLIAVRHGYIEIINLLLKAGADSKPEKLNGRDLVMVAVNYNQLASVEALVEAGLDAHRNNHQGDTALVRAMKLGHKKIAKFIIEHTLGTNLNINLEEQLNGCQSPGSDWETCRKELLQYYKKCKNAFDKPSLSIITPNGITQAVIYTVGAAVNDITQNFIRTLGIAVRRKDYATTHSPDRSVATDQPSQSSISFSKI